MIDLSVLKESLGGKAIAVFGLGKSGMPVFESCQAAGIETVLWDDNEAARANAIEKGAAVEDLITADWSRFAALCLSPGVPFTHPAPHPVVLAAQAAGVEILGDIELFHRAKPDVRTIGVTGTNGKSTTTALIGHILKQADVPCAVGGNIGAGILSLPDLELGGVYVIEMSSYQLDLCTTFAPDVAMLINLGQDHLERHGGMEGYIAAKARIFEGRGTAIIGVDDDDSAALYADVRGHGARQVVSVSCGEEDDPDEIAVDAVYVNEEGVLWDKDIEILDLKTCPSLQGLHNWQNAGMAYVACRAVGVEADEIVKAMPSFTGLAHRQNIVMTYKGVTYINDSKATNDESAAQALRTYKRIYWIAGGQSKGGGYSHCEKHLDHICQAFVIGDAADEMAAWFEENNIKCTKSGTLESAVQAASAAAEAGHEADDQETVVLLSPACASWDQFKSFEHRGDCFVQLVQGLIPKKEAV